MPSSAHLLCTSEIPCSMPPARSSHVTQEWARGEILTPPHPTPPRLTKSASAQNPACALIPCLATHSQVSSTNPDSSWAAQVHLKAVFPGTMMLCWKQRHLGHDATAPGGLSPSPGSPGEVPIAASPMHSYCQRHHLRPGFSWGFRLMQLFLRFNILSLSGLYVHYYSGSEWILPRSHS